MEMVLDDFDGVADKLERAGLDEVQVSTLLVALTDAVGDDDHDDAGGGHTSTPKQAREHTSTSGFDLATLHARVHVELNKSKNVQQSMSKNVEL